ncbi:MAG: hypothetical protein RL141_106 [Candidatus Parcubacteria bacterium]|jgi:D-alanyl-D-alanine carboxypeptidase
MIRRLLFACILACVPLVAHAAPVPSLKPGAVDPALDPSTFASLLVIDVASGKTLYQSQPNRVWTPASLTKLMTAVSYTATPRTWAAAGTITSADEVGGGRLAVASGSRMTLRDLLYSAVVGSANNAAEALARQSGIGREPFITKMNADALALGMASSTFRDASGMHASNTTTAIDMAILLDRASQQAEIQKAMVTFNYKFTIAAPVRSTKNIKNTNGLLFIEPDIWVTAGKTGYLEESKYNLAVKVKPSPKLLAAQTAAGNPGGELAIIVLGSPTRDGAVKATATLAKWAWDHIQWQGDAATFPRNRGLDDRGADVKALQVYLNTHGAPIASTGPGSPGKETETFGTLTKAALARFQQSHAADILTPLGRTTASGYLDFQTRAYIHGAITPAVIAPSSTSAVVQEPG